MKPTLIAPGATAPASTAPPESAPRQAPEPPPEPLPPVPAAVPRGRLRRPLLPMKPPPHPSRCRCGRPVFFRDTACAGCGTPLGYDPLRRLVIPLEPLAPTTAGGQPPTARWREAGVPPRRAALYRRCAHLETASGCNWLVDERDRNTANARNPAQCRSCRLTRTFPKLSIEPHPLWWQHIEVAKRRLVALLIALGLPVAARIGDDPRHGLAFDLLRAPPGGPRVVTGHIDGVITIDVEEADEATRERRRNRQREPQRNVLGHLRHETGHYYWQRLVEGSDWLAAFRDRFGDERQPYRAALRRYYDDGPPADWPRQHVSAYASCHPWEDWAETWAYYLQLMDTLEVARGFGAGRADRVALNRAPFGAEALDVPAAAADGGEGDPQAAAEFLATLNGWVALTGVVNELAHGMGLSDLYPVGLSVGAARKLHFVHRVVCAAAARGQR